MNPRIQISFYVYLKWPRFHEFDISLKPLQKLEPGSRWDFHCVLVITCIDFFHICTVVSMSQMSSVLRSDLLSLLSLCWADLRQELAVQQVQERRPPSSLSKEKDRTESSSSSSRSTIPTTPSKPLGIFPETPASSIRRGG